MMQWINGRPQMWYGYTNFGPIQIPPTPRYIRLTDRATGTVWWLTYSTAESSTDGYGYISISDAVPPTPLDTITFAAYEEPYFVDNPDRYDQHRLPRLIVRNGYLGVEEFSQDFRETDMGNLRLYARKAGLNIPMRQIILSRNTLPDSTGGWYAWVPFTIVQTPNPT